MKSINPNAPVKCIKKIMINANSIDVWNVLTNIDNWSLWQKRIKSAKINGPLQSGTSFKWRAGLIRIRSVLHTVVPYTNLGWEGKSMGLYAIHNWTIHEINKSVEVTVEESMEGTIAKLFKKPLNNSLDKSTRAWMEFLKKECELLEK